MHFKKSEKIARLALEIGCDPEDVETLDEYLAYPHREYFTLFDTKSKTGLGDCTEPLLDMYVEERILREPQARHLCPEHDIGLDAISDIKGKCIDCGKTYLLDDCESEMLYKRISTPETWSTSEVATISISADKTETPLRHDKKWLVEQTFKVLMFLIALGTCLLTAFSLFLQHQNQISQPVSFAATRSSPDDQSSSTSAISSTSIEQPPALNIVAASTAMPSPTNEPYPTAMYSEY